jgi:hypothetical protein
MDSTELLTQFRSDVVDEELPQLWSDTEVFSYIDSAQKQFCREVGGIADASSPLTTLAVVMDTEWVAASPLILKVRAAYLPDGAPIEVVNYEDLVSRGFRLDGRTGPVKMLVIGMEAGRYRLYPKPVASTTVQLVVDRLPLKAITDADQKLELQDHHKEGLGLWMRHRAYSKQDAETMDKSKALLLKQEFGAYCAAAKKERDRAKHKTRVIQYGGL